MITYFINSLIQLCQIEMRISRDLNLTIQHLS